MASLRSDFKASWVDDFIGFFSPRAKARRIRAKVFSSKVKRKYEGADSGRRTDGWIAHGNSANAEAQNALGKLRNRSRDLVRNNPYAKRGINLIANNVVGPGIQTHFREDDQLEDTPRERAVNGAWRAWSRTTACDFERKLTLAGMQRLVMKSVGESGEVLVRFRREAAVREVLHGGQKWRVPAFSLQVLENDFLETNSTPVKRDDGGTTKMGIVLDEDGRRIAYRIYQDHPGDIHGGLGAISLKLVEIPVSEMLHIYEVDRPGQLRGIPFLAPVMLRLRDFDLFEDATLKRQQCAAMFTAFVHDIEDMDVDDIDDLEEELGEKMEPGLIEVLPPGKTVTLARPPGAENYDEYTKVVLHSIATGLGLTYTALTGNLAEVNFSSGRMGWLEMQRQIEVWRKELILDQFMTPVETRFREEMELVNVPALGTAAVFTPPRREMIDPSKEVGATKEAIGGGLKTLSEAIREQGKDPETHLKEYAADQKRLEELGLTLDTSSSSGQTEDSPQED